MTNQEALNNAYEYHVHQGKPPGYDGYNCRYHDEKGRKCAIGCQLPNSERFENVSTGLTTIFYLAKCEENANNHLTVELAKEVVAHFEGCDVKFLSDLQVAHDTAAEMTFFHERVKAEYGIVAANWNLQIPE